MPFVSSCESLSAGHPSYSQTVSLKIPLWSFRPLVLVLLDHLDGQGGLFINDLPVDPPFHIPLVLHSSCSTPSSTTVTRKIRCAPLGPLAFSLKWNPSLNCANKDIYQYNRSISQVGLGCYLGYHALPSFTLLFIPGPIELKICPTRCGSISKIPEMPLYHRLIRIWKRVVTNRDGVDRGALTLLKGPPGEWMLTTLVVIS